MTDKVQKIKEFLIGMAGAACCDANTKKHIETIILPFIDSLQEEPVSEDLEYASEKYACRFSSSKYGHDKVKEAFIAGADWQRHYEAKCREENNICCMPFDDIDAARFAAYEQGKMDMKEQFEKERLKHCEALTKEQAQIESDFVTQHLKNNNRTPTFIDAIEYGMRLQKEQMMAKAIDGEVGYWNLRGLSVNVKLPRSVGECDKVKVFVVKED